MQGGNQGVGLVELAVTLAVAADQTGRIASGGLHA